MSFFLCFFCALLVSYFITPLIRKFSFWIGAIDKPNARNIHVEPMPRMGGLGIFISFFVTTILIWHLSNTLTINDGLALLFGSSIIVLTGMLDDRFGLSAKTKLLGQSIAAYITIYFGIKIEFIIIPFSNEPIAVGWFGMLLTLLWILGITNAINLIDGLDGLASGIVCIAAIAFFLISLLEGNSLAALMSIILLGSTIGFLRHNFFPAKIFMGDTGSLFLGYTLSTIALLELKQATILSFLVPIITLGVPILDTLYAIVRRKLNRQPIWIADKNHLHHRLLSMRLSHRNVVLVIYTISAIFAFLAISISQSPWWLVLVIVFVIIISIEILAEYIGLLNSTKRPLLLLFSKISSQFTKKN